MTQLIITVLLMAIAAACDKSKKKECIDKDLIDPNAVCTMDYNPVCGCDEKTYSNECMAKNGGVISWENGECPTSDQ